MKEIYQIILELTSKKSDGIFKLSQSHLVDKIINHAGITVSASLKAKDTPSVKPLLHKDEYSIGRKCVWNYREAVSILSCIHGSTRPEISMSVHQCARFFNNPRLVHEISVRCIAKYLASTSTYVDLPSLN